MAIQKTKTLPSGVIGNYWRIYSITVDVDTLNVTFSLGLYVDQASSGLGKQPILKGKNYSFHFTREQILSGNIMALGYTAILAKASTLVPPPFDLDATHIPFDSDLSDGVSVL